MRNLVAIVTIAILVLSCTVEDYREEDISLQYASQKWQLVRMTGNSPNSVTEGDNLEWQEYYIFHPDGTFSRSRSRDEIVTEANGTLEMVEYDNDDMDYLELTYKSGLELIGNCGGTETEVLVYRSATALSNTWNACDGSGMDYELVTN